ncbi:hypothetical protein IF188_00240 [Microbacterium sp. NEAU-LLC]|uniref:DUF3137 domain-containing protein n=1 Tax=Microbacterium helvum TaxID=2773713 RepID=A0ABR8NHG7_9MICO|nr:hypothetical protein [Microbacterium helvum]MBD3940125.1 hypothetical protein [Microbacterium helvum]
MFLAAFFAWLLLGTGEVSTDDIVVAVSAIVLAAGVVVVTGNAVAADLRRRRGLRQYRLSRFAAANRLTYAPVERGLELPGMIFGARDGQVTWDVMRDAGGLAVGNQTFTTGSGKNRRTHRWGFASVRLGTELPHLVLDATSNDALRVSNLPVSLDRAQRLSLEGDFDRHFALYAPVGYERDALYLFTPDVMARFVDHAAALDVEIVDDRLLLYARRDLSTLDPEVWEWLFATLQALTAKVEQWQRWRDDRLGETHVVTEAGSARIVRPPRGVAARGRRLTERVHWIWIVLGLALAGFGLFSMLDDAFGLIP